MKILYAWDFHGVLEKDNEIAVMKTCNKVMRKYGKSRRITEDETLDWYGRSWQEYFKRLSPGSSPSELDDMVEDALVIGMEVKDLYVKPMDHAMEVLSEIKNEGNSNIIISNTRPAHIQNFVDLVGISTYVDGIIGVPKEKEHSKLDIAMHKGMELFRYARENGFSMANMIGDRETDVQAGEIAGAYTYRFASYKDLRNESIEDIKRRTIADKVITDLRDVLKYGPIV